MWLQVPVIITTWGAETGKLLEPRRWRLQWANIVPLRCSLDDRLVSKKKKSSICSAISPASFSVSFCFVFCLFDNSHSNWVRLYCDFYLHFHDGYLVMLSMFSYTYWLFVCYLLRNVCAVPLPTFWLDYLCVCVCVLFFFVLFCAFHLSNFHLVLFW